MNNNFNKEIYTKINELFYHDKKRLAHVLGVADLTFALAARYNVNLDDAYVAGLLSVIGILLMGGINFHF